MWSRLSLIVCYIAMLYASFVFFPRWKQPNGQNVLSWDGAGYYWYLPSIFIYEDLKAQGFKDSIIARYHPSGDEFQMGYLHESGNYVMKYSSGQAIMFLPFFLAAHALAEPLGYPADGFSAPYQLGIQIGGVLCALIGLYFFRRLLLLFFSDKVTAACLLILVLGTNYLNYGAIDVSMSHGWLFTIYAGLLLLTVSFYRRPSIGRAIGIGLLTGLATLTRPTDIISILIPLLWGLEGFSRTALRGHLSFLRQHRLKLLAAAVCSALVFSIQLIYWKYATGSWLVYSYQGQRFHWTSPHVLKYLISPLNGWLAYAPVLALGLIGLWFYMRKGAGRVAVLCFLLIDLYLVTTWEFYYYGGRFMVQAYPVLFLPLASFLDWITGRHVRKFLFVPLIILCCYVGLWTNIQYHYGGLYDWDVTNGRYYWHTVGRWAASEDVMRLKDTDEVYWSEPTGKELVYANDFERDTAACELPALSGERSVCLSKEKVRLSYSFPYPAKNRKWLRAEATFYCKWRELNVWNMAQFAIVFLKEGREVKKQEIRIYRFLEDRQTRRIHVDAKVPEEDADTVRIQFFNHESDRILMIDDLKVWAYGD